MTKRSRHRSEELAVQAEELIPGGVNSPVRAFKSVGGHPYFVQRGQGSRIWDEDGNEYIDYVCSWGALILGHAHPQVLSAIGAALERGTTYGAPCVLELELAQLVREAVPSIEMVRMVSSGTEAAMSAIRLARGFTGRDDIVKFNGCYHGHSDGLLAKAGSGVAAMGVPDSPGVPADFTKHTLCVEYNDQATLERIFRERGKRIAAVIVEPVAANMGVVLPQAGFLEALRRITEDHDSLLIFDEVITGFRLGLGGAQELYGITPDITVLGKIVGGGMPVGAYGGRREIMEKIAPSGPIYQAGTLSGNPPAMAGGAETLRLLNAAEFYSRLADKTRILVSGIRAAADQTGVDVVVNHIASMFTIFFTHRPVMDLPSAAQSDRNKYAAFFHGMLDEGFAFAPSPFEAAFVSTALTEEQINRTVEAAREVFRRLA